jgi:signal transduction histidine kinase
MIELVEKFDLPHDKVLAMETWVVILMLSILVGIILMGMIIIFVYHQKTFQLYRLQNNFINNYTHELKTPVTSIQLYLETFLKHQISTEEQKPYIKLMLLDVNRLSEHINNILNISRFESLHSHETESVDIVEFIEKFIANNAHQFSNVFLKCEINAPIILKINTDLFEMLIRNLVNNAMIYNNNPQPEVFIHLKTKNNIIYIIFEDNGIGIEKKYRKKIFKKFYQIGKADDRSAKGTGLGLYMVDSITRMHGGKITVLENSRQTGSIFQLVFPLKKNIGV